MSASFDSGNERSQKETNVSSERRVLEGHTRPCEECAAVDWSLDTTRGEVTCNSCGLVVEENVPDPGAEWTQRDRGEDRSRVGAPMTYTLADRGLNTTIDVRDLNTGAASRHGISNQSRREWRRRRIIDERSKTRKSRERNLVKAKPIHSRPFTTTGCHARRGCPIVPPSFRQRIRHWPFHCRGCCCVYLPRCS